jgi:hypothetical protein
MKLSDIKLDESVIQDLYKKSLVETVLSGSPNRQIGTNDRTDSTKKRKPENHSAAVNQKNVLAIVNYMEGNNIPEEELALLTNMLVACKLGLDDIMIINLEQQPRPTYKEVISKLNNGIVLLFGTGPSSLELPVDFPYFQVQSFNNCTFLYTPSLEEIKNDKVLKSKLWICLRKIFNL